MCRTFIDFIGAATAARVLKGVQLPAGVGAAGSLLRCVTAAPAQRPGALLNVIDVAQTNYMVVAGAVTTSSMML